MRLIIKRITYFGKDTLLICDGDCHHAYGCNGGRFRGNDEGHTDEYMSANFGKSPKDPGTYEGVERKGKPINRRMNKWCARECERSTIVDLNSGQVEVDLPRFKVSL